MEKEEKEDDDDDEKEEEKGILGLFMLLGESIEAVWIINFINREKEKDSSPIRGGLNNVSLFYCRFLLIKSVQ